jgi:hypothetical protein
MMFLSNSAPNGVVTLAMVKDNMLNEELRRKKLRIISESSTLVIENQNSTHKNSHDDDQRDKSNMRSKSRKEIIYYYYKKLCHIKNERRKLKVKNDGLKRDQFRYRDGDNEKQHTAVIASSEEVFITYDECFINFTSQDFT